VKGGVQGRHRSRKVKNDIMLTLLGRGGREKKSSLRGEKEAEGSQREERNSSSLGSGGKAGGGFQ